MSSEYNTNNLLHEINEISKKKNNSIDNETVTDSATTLTLKDETLKIAVLKCQALEKQLKEANAKLQILLFVK